MAEWTIGTDSNPFHGRSGASTPVIRYFQESTAASTAVIKRGDIVTFDTVTSSAAGRIKRAVCGSGNGSNLLGATENVVGVAVEASTSDGSTTGLGENMNRMIGVAIAEPNCEFKGYLIGNSGALRRDIIGDQLAVRYDSTNHIFGIDSTNSTAALATVTVTDFDDNFIGDTNAPVYFRFLSSIVSVAVKAGA